MECRWAGRVRCVETGTGNVCHVVRTYVPFQRYRIYSLQAATFGSPRESSRLARETADEPSSFAAFSSSRPRLERSRLLWMTNSFGQWPRIGHRGNPKVSIYSRVKYRLVETISRMTDFMELLIRSIGSWIVWRVSKCRWWNGDNERLESMRCSNWLSMNKRAKKYFNKKLELIIHYVLYYLEAFGQLSHINDILQSRKL